MMKEADIFDRLFSMPVLRLFKPIYMKYKGVFLYLFFGVLTTAISIFSFAVFDTLLGINVLVSNALSWVLAVAFAYITNRKYVFNSSSKGRGVIKEAFLFVSARITTLFVEELIMFIFVVLLNYNGVVIKVIAQAVVLVLNYAVSKIIVFRKGEK